MRHKPTLLLPFLALLVVIPYPTPIIAKAVSTELQQQQQRQHREGGVTSAATTTTTIISAILSIEEDPPASSSLSSSSQETSLPLPLLERNQHTIPLAARTTSTPPSSAIGITLVPLPVPIPTTGSVDIDTSDITSRSSSTEEDSSSPATTVTITRSNGTTTIRPTLTVTSLFSTVEPTTSGAGGVQARVRESVMGYLSVSGVARLAFLSASISTSAFLI